MTEPERLPEMTSAHVEAVKHAAFDAPDFASGRPREILSVIQSLASGESINVPMKEIEEARQIASDGIQATSLIEPRARYAALAVRMSRWLSAAPPTGETK